MNRVQSGGVDGFGRLNSSGGGTYGGQLDSMDNESKSKQTLSRHSPVKLHSRVAALGLPEGGWSGGTPNSTGTPGSSGIYGFGDQSPWR